MDEDVADVPADAAAALRAQRSAAATAAAAAACAQLKASASGPYGKLHSSAQVLLLEDGELWDTLAVNWCKPGKEKIHEIVDTWEGRDLAACVYRLGLPVIYAKKNYMLHMRRSVVEAVRAHAARHPELFADPEAEDKEASGSEREASPSPQLQPPQRVQSAQAPASLDRAPVADGARRSPRSPASSRSVAAMAMAALNALPIVDVGPVRGAAGSARRLQKVAPAGDAAPPPVRNARHAPQRQPRAAVALHDVGAGGSDPSDSEGSDGALDEEGNSDSDSSWAPGHSDPVAASLRRGGRLRGEDTDHELGRAGMSRPFAQGFVANARFAAGGRSMYQLYKEVTASFTGESSRRECLALSRILDALLRGDTGAALEHTCRRLGGVHTAAETGNWAMCERLETEAEQRSFVPDAFMRSALKSVTQMQAVKKSATEVAGNKGAFGKAASATGRGERRSTAKPFKKEFNKENKDSGAGASHKKKGGSDSK